MTITKLRIHGARVVRSVGVMVDHVKNGNDEELLKTIKEVCIEQSMKLVYFVCTYRDSMVLAKSAISSKKNKSI